MSAGKKFSPLAWNPLEDGITHVNIYSKSRSVIGVFMSNLTPARIIHDGVEYGSVEALWFTTQLRLFAKHPVPEDRYEALRLTSGYRARELGKTLRDAWVPDDHRAEASTAFRNIIRDAIRQKFANQPSMRHALAQTGDLPLTHYYVFTSKVTGKESAGDAGHAWLVQFFSELRREFQAAPSYVFPPDTAFDPIPWPSGREPSWHA